MSAFDDFLSCNSMPNVLSSPSVPGILTQFKLVLGTQFKPILSRILYTASARWHSVRQNGTSSSSARVSKACVQSKGASHGYGTGQKGGRRKLELSSENEWELRAYVTSLITTTMSVSNASREPLRAALKGHPPPSLQDATKALVE